MQSGVSLQGKMNCPSAWQWDVISKAVRGRRGAWNFCSRTLFEHRQSAHSYRRVHRHVRGGLKLALNLVMLPVGVWAVMMMTRASWPR
ncbi:MAG: hypothetical protein ACLRSW_10245 [Christensenellaceae bacterium]